MPLLPGTDGKLKMSKSYGNDIGVTIAPDDMYGKVMSIPDAAMADYWRLTSGLPPADAERAIADLGTGALHPRDAKMRLARTVVARWHDAESARHAEESFVAQFQKHEVPGDAPTFDVPADVASVLDLVVATGVAGSKGEARRLIEGGGVELDGQRLGDWRAACPPLDGRVLKLGKRRWLKLRTKA
jgi:tyrosyl-tRNA synthetase